MIEKCKSCGYRKYLVNMACSVCYYCIDTGMLRDCDPEDCTYWIPKKKKQSKRVDIHLAKKGNK